MALPNLRQIFASFRSPLEEREYSRKAFYKFIGFLTISLIISILGSKGRKNPLLG